jgi:hypothetical protein
VETREQLDSITSEGCTEMQGFLFSQPLPVSEIERLFLSRHEKQTTPDRSSQPDRASFVALLASRIGAHVGWRCSVAAPESAIEIREVAEASFERDRTHSPVGKPRIDQHSMCPIESLDQYEF